MNVLRKGDWAVRNEPGRSIGIDEAERNRQVKETQALQQKDPKLYAEAVSGYVELKKALQRVESNKIAVHRACPDGRAHDVLAQADRDADEFLKSQAAPAVKLNASQATQQASKETSVPKAAPKAEPKKDAKSK